MQISGLLVDLARNCCVGMLTPAEKENSNLCELSTAFTLAQTIGRPEDLGVVVNVVWVDDSGRNEIAMLHENLEDAVNIIYKHMRPKKEDTPQRVGTQFLDQPPYDAAAHAISDDNKPIRLVFKRAPTVTADVDYICGFGTIKDNHHNFGVPGQGQLHLENATIIMEGDKAPTATCSVFRAGGGVTTDYSINYPQTVFFDRGGDLFYDIAMDWNQRYLERGSMEQVTFDYHLTITAYFIQGSRKRKVIQTVTSRKVMGPNTFPIPKLQFMWGCFAADTKIRKMDGTDVAIQDLQIGDLVALSGGGGGLVVNMWIGTEDRMISLKTADFSVCVTDNHPILTPDGYVRASHLRPGVQVCTDRGAQPLCEVCEVDYGRTVYNLDLEDELGGIELHCVIANGICASDNIGQNRCLPEESR